MKTKDMGIDYEMTWEGLKGRIYNKDKTRYTSCELTDECDEEDPEPMWFCMTEKVGEPFAPTLVGHFDIRKFAEAEEWCRSTMTELDEG